MRFVLLVSILFLFLGSSVGQINVPDPPCPYCGYRLPQDPVSTSDPNYLTKYHSPSCTLRLSSTASGGSVPIGSTLSQEQQLEQMVAGMFMQSLITAIFTSNTQQTQQQQWEAQLAELARLAEIAKQKRIQDSINQVKHAQMMGLYKPLEGQNANLDFKSLDGELENMRAQAGNMFEQGIAIDEAIGSFSSGTNFFGEMTADQINVLFEPENDPMVIDLRNAKAALADTGAYGKYVQSLKQSDPKRPTQEKLSEDECQKLEQKIARDKENKSKYQQSIDKTLIELDKWKEENDAALMAAFREGLGFLTDKYVSIQNEKKEPALLTKDAMKKVLEKDPTNAAAKKVIEFLDKNYLNKNWREAIISNYNDIKDADNTYAVIKDAMQNTLTGLSAKDKELAALLQSEELKPYLNDESLMSAFKFSFDYFFNLAANSDKAQKALESVFKAKIPYVSLAQFAINQAYNATQWYQSRQRILELNNVHGKELETSHYLQNRIFDAELKLTNQCNN